MGAGRSVVRITANFEANLADIERFLGEAGAARAFEALLDRLSDAVIPNLERFPRMGRRLLASPAGSVEGIGRIERLKSRWPDFDLRESVEGDYLVFYAVGSKGVYLLAIRHHRQLSFDLAGHWPPTRSSAA